MLLISNFWTNFIWSKNV